MKQEDHHKLLLACIQKAKRVYIIGNGGSAANAIHAANDLVSCGIKAQALTADVATLTAIANDYGYEYVFSRQLGVLGEEGDLLITFSGSGNSHNIIQAIYEAILQHITVFSITGAWNQNKASQIAHYAVQYGDNMQVAEDYQLQIIHKVYRILKGLE